MDNNLPRHIAIVPDGNRRWAELHGVPKLEGHRAGADRMHQVVDQLVDLRIGYLTVWGFSSDNWNRTAEEIDSIFKLLGLWIEKDTPWLHEKGVRLRHIGRLHELPPVLWAIIIDSVRLTADNQGMTLNLALNYTGRAETVDAVRRLIADGVPPRNVDEHLFARYLYTDGMPDVDLVIRTADELRLSNFMLWQTAYSEYYFTPVFWPDFDRVELDKALEAYKQRCRRYGGD
ncbi:Ditrans,polycis-undecaprenyl-diphosphate synthase ((2E,6E)-farnesyl-diphosphate specific) [subsurface metagenome]